MESLKNANLQNIYVYTKAKNSIGSTGFINCVSKGNHCANKNSTTKC